MQHTPPLIEDIILHAKAQGIPVGAIARQLDVDTSTVRAVVRRHGDLAEHLREVQSDYLSAGFKFMWLDSLDYFRTHSQAGTLSPQDRKNLALTAAISVDKVAMIQGWPTQVVAHLHEHRHQVGDIADKLAAVARRLGEAQVIPDRDSGITI